MGLLIDVRWMVAFVVLLHILDQPVLSFSSCSHIITGNSTHNAQGSVASPDFPSLQDSTYTCSFEFLPLETTGEYLELIFTDFILDNQDTVACSGFISLYTVSIQESPQVESAEHCERPKRHVFPLTERATVELISRRQHILQAFRVAYRFLPSSEGESLSRQTTHEVTRYNYDTRNNYQGSLTDEVDYMGKEIWVDVLHYIRAPVGHKIALTAAFMQDHRTTSLEIHDGATSSSDRLAESLSSSREVYESTQDWIYVRWNGEAGGGVTLDIDFTFFRESGSSGTCAGNYFKCTSGRCIPSKLLCNGVDNCYDGPTRNDEDPQGECRAVMTPTPVPASLIPRRTSFSFDPCELEPCLRFAICITSGTSFRCQCPRNYLGYTCVKPTVQPNNNSCGGEECRNGGTCISQVCVCPEGYTGAYCEFFGDGGTVSGNCAEECLNGGSCNANNECQCAQGYFGPHCEYVDNTGGPDYTDLQHTSIMIGAFVGAVCLLSICWLIAMARKRQTDTQPEGGRLQRIVSVHSPEESGLRRHSTIVASTNIELPPNYSDAILYREGSFNNKSSQRPIRTASNRRISADEPLSPPPSYDAVASDNEDEGIVFRIPETVPEDDDDQNSESDQPLHILSDQALPDVVTSQENNQTSNPSLTRHDTPV